MNRLFGAAAALEGQMKILNAPAELVDIQDADDLSARAGGFRRPQQPAQRFDASRRVDLAGFDQGPSNLLSVRMFGERERVVSEDDVKAVDKALSDQLQQIYQQMKKEGNADRIGDRRMTANPTSVAGAAATRRPGWPRAGPPVQPRRGRGARRRSAAAPGTRRPSIRRARRRGRRR